MNQRRMLKLFVCLSEDVNSPNGKRLIYGYHSDTQERQLADDFAKECNMRRGEGYFNVYDLEDNNKLLHQLQLPA